MEVLHKYCCGLDVHKKSIFFLFSPEYLIDGHSEVPLKEFVERNELDKINSYVNIS